MSLIRVFLFSFIMILSHNAYSLVFYNQWNQSFEKELVLDCDYGEESICLEVCNEERLCVVKEEVCQNCVANTAQMSDVFTNMGRTYVNTTEIADIDSVIDLIKSGEFVSINSKSLYNMIYEFDSFELRQNFQSLCPVHVGYPVVIFDKLSNGEMGKVRYVGCGDTTYVMDHNSGISSTISELY
ncbi:hypothetical protein M899_0339 [Bacteriovorax sp. BSW11_IV]|uniref:hypothetical protein n=1 Tax=Bacteriovorax sp. BSW11_IV TaxID=1353529 RepID=UPI00038A32CF|nr:hypothetical protein [Bacteriovorax sp. BSW11_IV]EQC50255.1 hypothetical protein M899_0339 [Bacteriovorax sp. BSW11_IV]